MCSRLFVGAVCLFVVFSTHHLGAQDPEFEYQIQAPKRVGGPPGSLVQYRARVQLVTNNLKEREPGARGWQVAVTADGDPEVGNWKIINATTLSTLAADISAGGLRNGGFEKTELTSGPGNEGAISAVILSNSMPITLDPGLSPADILVLTLEGRTPREPDCVICRPSFTTSLQGSGQPVENIVTYEGESFIPKMSRASVEVCSACFVNEPVLGQWRSVPIGNDYMGAARLVDRECYEICSIGRGHMSLRDELMALTQRARSDMQLVVGIRDFEGVGEAGVCIRGNSRFDDGAYMGIALRRLPNGDVQIVSSIRPQKGGRIVSGKPVDFKPAEFLGIRREGNKIVTLFGNSPDDMKEDMVQDISKTSLMREFQELIMACGSDGRGQARAVFCDPKVSIREIQTPPLLRAISPNMGPVSGGTEVVIAGAGLQDTEAVLIAGVPARITEVNENFVMATTGASDRVVLGDVVVITPTGSEVLKNAYYYLGRGYIRGDCNCDKILNIADASKVLGFLFLGNAPCCCDDAGDANGDGLLNIADASKILGFLFLGDPPPPFPFPEPGVPPGPSRPCDLPPQPEVTDVSPGVIREGDIVTIKGSGFSPDPEQNVVLFGADARGEVIDAAVDSLRVKVGCLPTAEIVDVSILRIHPDLLPFLCKTTKCSPFITGLVLKTPFSVERLPSELELIAHTGLKPSKPGPIMELQIPDNFDRTEPLDVSGGFFLPAVQGLSLGDVNFMFEHHDPNPDRSFEEWMIGLADQFERNLSFLANGLKPVDLPGVGAGVATIATTPLMIDVNAAEGLLRFSPTKEMAGFLDILDGGISIYGQPKCKCDEFDPEDDERDYGWCRFTKLLQNCGGRPKWEYFIPENLVMQQSDDIFPLDDPVDYSPGDKRVMYNKDAYCHVRKHNLWNPCKIQKLGDDGEEKIPDFPCKAIVIKTQWRTAAQLPADPDPDTLYYHYDYDGTRRYLTLLHYTDKSRQPWHWADLYVPESLGGIGGCGGSDVGRPAGAPWVAPWTNYYMCTNITDPPSPDCGNMEIPIECVETCQGCHRDASSFGVDLDFLFSVGDGPFVAGSPDCD